MKKILILIAIFSLFMTLFFLVTAKEKQEIKPLPEYSLEGVTPKVYYYEWYAKHLNWYILYILDDPSNAKGIVMKKEVFVVDRNKDGVADLKIFKYYMPEGEYEDNRGRKLIAKAHVSLIVMVDDDLDKLWDRELYDEFDASGNLGMDGVFEEEEIVRY